MARGRADRRRSELPELLASVLEARGATVARDGMVWDAALTPELQSALGVERVRLVAAPAGRAARGAEMDAAMTERILLLGRSHGQVTHFVAATPWPRGASPEPRVWVRLHWRIRYGSDEIPEELLVQELPIGNGSGMRAPKDSALRPATPDEASRLPRPEPDALAATWTRAIRLLEVYREAARSGQIEIATSAYHHPILPLLFSTDAPREISNSIPLPAPPFRAPEDAVAQVTLARESHARRFGAMPRGTWPPEGAVNQETLALLRAEGFAWCASDETVLARALGRGEPGGPGWAGALYRPYRVETGAGPIAMVFRDRELSDRIGFTYQAWEPGRAAEDFVGRVLDRGAAARGDGVEAPLVTVILDGENCWESYAEDGRAFLDALYARLDAESSVEALTVGEALDRTPPADVLAHVPVGSWIAPDLAIWVGHPEKNRAWSELRRVRERWEEVARDGVWPADRLAQARDEIRTAEASDWFWWYGDDHQSAHKEEFDSLFRSHVIRAYSLLGWAAPAALRRSLRGVSAPAEEDAEHVPYLTPTLDGRDTHFYEWRNAELYDGASEQGADHRVSGVIRRVLFGVNERDLFVRVDGVGSVDPARAILLTFRAPCAAEARARLSEGPRGALDGSTGSGDPGEFAAGDLIEIRVPLARLLAGPETDLRWSVALEESGRVSETIPRTGQLSARTLDAEFTSRNWSAT